MSDKPNEELKVDIPEKELSAFENLFVDDYVLEFVANFDAKYQEIEEKAKKLDDKDPKKIEAMLALRTVKGARAKLVKIGKDIVDGKTPFAQLSDGERMAYENRVRRATLEFKKGLNYLANKEMYELTEEVLIDSSWTILFAKYIRGIEVEKILDNYGYYKALFLEKAVELDVNIDAEIDEFESVVKSIAAYITDYVEISEHTPEERQKFYGGLKELVREFRAVLYKLEEAGVYKMSKLDRNLYTYNNLPQQQEDYDRTVSKLRDRIGDNVDNSYDKVKVDRVYLLKQKVDTLDEKKESQGSLNKSDSDSLSRYSTEVNYLLDALGGEAKINLDRLGFLKSSVEALYETMESQGGLSEDDGELLARYSTELNYLLYALDEEDDSISTLGRGKEFPYSDSAVSEKIESRKESDERGDKEWEWLEERCLGVVDSARKAQSKLQEAYFDTNNKHKSGRYYLDILNVNINKTISFMLDVVDGKRPYNNSPALPKTVGASVWNGDHYLSKMKKVDPQSIEGAISIAEERLGDVDKFIKAYEIMDDVVEDRQKILEVFDDAIDYNKEPSKSSLSKLKSSLKNNYDKCKKTGYLSNSNPYYRNGNFPAWESFSISSNDRKFFKEGFDEALKLVDVMSKDMRAYFEVSKEFEGKVLAEMPEKKLQTAYKKLARTYLGKHREIDVVKKYGKIFSKKFVSLMGAIEIELIGRETQDLHAIDLEQLLKGNGDYFEFLTPNSELDDIDREMIPIPEHNNYIGKKILLKPALIDLLKRKEDLDEDDKKKLEEFKKAFDQIGVDLINVSLTGDVTEVDPKQPVLLFDKFIKDFKDEGKDINGVFVPYVRYYGKEDEAKVLVLTDAYYLAKKEAHEDPKLHEDSARTIAKIDSVIEHFGLVKYMKIQKVQASLDDRSYVLDYYKGDDHLRNGDKEKAKEFYLAFLEGVKSHRENSQDPTLEFKIEQAKSRLKMFAMDEVAQLHYQLSVLQRSVEMNIDQKKTIWLGEATPTFIKNNIKAYFDETGDANYEAYEISISKFHSHIIKGQIKSQSFALEVASKILSKDNEILSLKDALKETKNLHEMTKEDSVKYMNEVLGFTDTDAAEDLILSGDLSKWVNKFQELDRSALDEKWAEYGKSNPGAAKLLKNVERSEMVSGDDKKRYDEAFGVLDSYMSGEPIHDIARGEKLKGFRMYYASQEFQYNYFEEAGLFEACGVGRGARKEFYKECLTDGSDLHKILVDDRKSGSLSDVTDNAIKQERLSREDKTLTQEEEELISKRVSENYDLTIISRLWREHVVRTVTGVLSRKSTDESLKKKALELIPGVDEKWEAYEDDFEEIDKEFYEFWRMTAQESGEFWTSMVMDLPAFVAMGWGASAAGKGITGLVMRRQAMKELASLTIKKGGSAFTAKAAGFAAETLAFSEMMMLNSALPSGNVHHLWSPTEQIKSWGESVLTLGVLKMVGSGAQKIGATSRYAKAATLPFIPIVDAAALTGTQYLWHSAFEGDHPFDAAAAIRGNLAFSIGIRMGQRMISGKGPSSQDRGIKRFNREQYYEKVMKEYNTAPRESRGKRPSKRQIFKVADYLYEGGVADFGLFKGMEFGKVGELIKWSKARGIDARSWEKIKSLEARKAVLDRLTKLEARAKDIKMEELMDIYSREHGQVIIEMLARNSKAKLSKSVREAAEFIDGLGDFASELFGDLPSTKAKGEMLDFLMSRFHARELMMLEGTNLTAQERMSVLERVRDFEGKVESFDSELMLGETVAELYQSGKAGRLAAKILTVDPNMKVEGRTREVMNYITENSFDAGIVEGMTPKESWNFALESINLDISRDTWRQFEGKDAKLKALESVRSEVDSVLTDPKKTVSKPDFERFMNTAEGRTVLEVLSRRSGVKFEIEYADIVELAKADALTADLFVENLARNHSRMFNRISRQYSRDLIKELGMSKAELRNLFGRAYEGHNGSLQKIFDAFNKTGGGKLAIIAGSSLFLQGCNWVNWTIGISSIGTPVLVGSYVLYRMYRSGRLGSKRSKNLREDLKSISESFVRSNIRDANDALKDSVKPFEQAQINNRADFNKHYKKVRGALGKYSKTLDPNIRKLYKAEAKKYLEKLESAYDFDKTTGRLPKSQTATRRNPGDNTVFDRSDLMIAIESFMDSSDFDISFKSGRGVLDFDLPNFVKENISRGNQALEAPASRFKEFTLAYANLMDAMASSHLPKFADSIPAELITIITEAVNLHGIIDARRIFLKASRSSPNFENNPRQALDQAQTEAFQEFARELMKLDSKMKADNLSLKEDIYVLINRFSRAAEQPSQENTGQDPQNSQIVDHLERPMPLERPRSPEIDRSNFTPTRALNVLSDYFRTNRNKIIGKDKAKKSGRRSGPGESREGGKPGKSGEPGVLRKAAAKGFDKVAGLPGWALGLVIASPFKAFGGYVYFKLRARCYDEGECGTLVIDDGPNPDENIGYWDYVVWHDTTYKSPAEQAKKALEAAATAPLTPTGAHDESTEKAIKDDEKTADEEANPEKDSELTGAETGYEEPTVSDGETLGSWYKGDIEKNYLETKEYLDKITTNYSELFSHEFIKKLRASSTGLDAALTEKSSKSMEERLKKIDTFEKAWSKVPVRFKSERHGKFPNLVSDGELVLSPRWLHTAQKNSPSIYNNYAKKVHCLAALAIKLEVAGDKVQFLKEYWKGEHNDDGKGTRKHLDKVLLELESEIIEKLEL